MGVGAMTDFGPLIANPKTLLLGAAAQLGIFMTSSWRTPLLGFTAAGSRLHRHHRRRGRPDGHLRHRPVSLPHLLGPIAVAAYSYMALVPVIQPPIMKALTTKKERKIVMKQLRQVTKKREDHLPHRGHRVRGAACCPPPLR